MRSEAHFNINLTSRLRSSRGAHGDIPIGASRTRVRGNFWIDCSLLFAQSMASAKDFYRLSAEQPDESGWTVGSTPATAPALAPTLPESIVGNAT
jgi:hypothetical protein